MESNKIYIGDGVYAYFDGYHIVIETGGDTIYLDSHVAHALVDYIKSIWSKEKESEE